MLWELRTAVSMRWFDERMKMDDEVDEINKSMYGKVFEKIRENSDDVETLILYLSASRHLERIADYATNIAEDVIYMIDGAIVRHQPQA